MLKFGIIGCGKIAERHAELIVKTGILIAVCDIDEDKGRAFAQKYNALFYKSSYELLRSEHSMDVMVICTPNWLHATQSIESLTAGFHVLCEKPMALYATDCVAMLDAAQKNNRQLFVVKQNRFNPPVVAVKQAMDDNLLGRLYSFHLSCLWNRSEPYYEHSWHGKLKEDGGTLFTQFSHFIDLLYWLMGDVKKVTAVTRNLGHANCIETEDTGTALIEMANGAIGTLHYSVNSFLKNMEGALTMLGEKGAVKIGGQYLNVLEYQLIENHQLPSDKPETGPNEYGFYTGSMSNHNKVYENLADVLLRGKRSYMDAHDAMRTVAIIELIYNAAKTNNR